MTSKKFAVFGYPIEHSYSPTLHALFAKQCGIEGSFTYTKECVLPSNFEQRVKAFFADGGTGLNITIPFKIKAVKLAKQLSQHAQIAGAANTLWQQGNVIHGTNTDGIGLVKDIQRLGACLSSRILLLGAGGAARGVIPSLIEAGCSRLHIANRTKEKAIQLAHDMQTHYPSATISASGLNTIPEKWDIIINASASSLDDRPLPIDNALFAKNSLAYDMLYSKNGITAFLQQAQQYGSEQIADGLGMLAHQGAESFYIWNHVYPNTTHALDKLRAIMLGNEAPLINKPSFTT